MTILVPQFDGPGNAWRRAEHPHTQNPRQPVVSGPSVLGYLLVVKIWRVRALVLQFLVGSADGPCGLLAAGANLLCSTSVSCAHLRGLEHATSSCTRKPRWLLHDRIVVLVLS